MKLAKHWKIIPKFSRKEKALTLLEIVISVAIFSLVALAVSVVFNRSIEIYRESADRTQAAQLAQMAMEWLVRDIQSAYAVVEAEFDNIGLIVPDENTAPNLCYIQHYLSGQTIQRTDCSGINYLLVEGVDNLGFSYYDINNNNLGLPVSAANLASIKSVEIDLTTQRRNAEFRLNTVARFEYNPAIPWAKAYGGPGVDITWDVARTDGGYLLGGRTGSFGVNTDFLAVNTNFSGDVLWANAYGGSGWDVLITLYPNDTEYILGGYTTSFGYNTEFLAMSTNLDGTVNWAWTYGAQGDTGYGDVLMSIDSTSDGNFLFGGLSDSGFGNYQEFLVIKANPSAASAGVVWAYVYGGTGYDWLSSLKAIGANYLFGGPSYSFDNNGDFLVIQTGSDGVPAWAWSYGGGGEDDLRGLDVSGSNYIFGGFSNSFGNGYDFLVIKANPSNTNAGVSWAFAYGGSGEDRLFSLQTTSDEGCILGGKTTSFGAGANDFLVIKIDVNGAVEWAKAYGGANEEVVFTDPGYNNENYFSIRQTSDGGYILGGPTETFGQGSPSSPDYLAMKIDAQGNLLHCIPAFTVTDVVTSTYTHPNWHRTNAQTYGGWHAIDADQQWGNWAYRQVDTDPWWWYTWHDPVDADASGNWHAPIDVTSQLGWGVSRICP